MHEDDGIEEVEVVTTAVGEDGTVVVDDLKALVDEDGNVLATDETIAVEAPDGTVVIDEVIAVADDDGELEVVEEDVVVIEERGRARSALELLQRVEGAVRVDVHADLALDHLDHPAVLVDHERHALGRLLAGDAHHRGDLAVGVGEQRVVEPVLLRELVLLVDRCRS